VTLRALLKELADRGLVVRDITRKGARANRTPPPGGIGSAQMSKPSHKFCGEIKRLPKMVEVCRTTPVHGGVGCG